jgi:hypothetical protein
MQKIQILFPEPDMRRLRDLARREDRPISEIVRRATEAWIERSASACAPAETRVIPVFHGGRTLIPAGAMRDVAWQERLLGVAEGSGAWQTDEQP